MTARRRTVRVATWNILSGRDMSRGAPDLGRVAAAVTALDADVVALQEVDRHLDRTDAVAQLQEIADRSGHFALFAPALLGEPGTGWFAPVGPDPGGPAYGIGLLTRVRPLRWRRLRLPGAGKQSPSRRLLPRWDHEPRVAVQAELDVPGAPLLVTATHLSYMPWRGVRQLRALLPVAGRRRPCVLLGDLNLPPWAVRTAAPGWRSAGGSPTYPADEPRVQIDHILGRGVRLGTAHNRRFDTSDHVALVADVALDGV